MHSCEPRVTRQSSLRKALQEQPHVVPPLSTTLRAVRTRMSPPTATKRGESHTSPFGDVSQQLLGDRTTSATLRVDVLGGLVSRTSSGTMDIPVR